MRCCPRWGSSRGPTSRSSSSPPGCASAWRSRGLLLQDARVLLLDEPYGELDPAGFALLDRVLGEQQAPRRHGAARHAPARPRPRAVRRGDRARGGTRRLVGSGARPARRRGTRMKGLWAALRKDLLLQWRTRAQAAAVFAFGASALLLFSFAVGPTPRCCASTRPASCGSASCSPRRSRSPRASRPRWSSARSRACCCCRRPRARSTTRRRSPTPLRCSCSARDSLPMMVVLYDAATPRVPPLLGIVLLGSAGLSAPGTLYAAMTAQARARQTLLPLLLFPLVVPVAARLGQGHVAHHPRRSHGPARLLGAAARLLRR